MPKTIVIAVDTWNLYRKVSKKFPNSRLDFKSYINMAKGDDILYRSIAYTHKTKPEASKFLSCLRQYGYDVRCKETTNIWYDSWDVGITVDLMNIVFANKVDKIILGSSNSIFVPLIESIKSRGIECEIFSSLIPPDVKSACTGWKEITEDLLLKGPDGDKAE